MWHILLATSLAIASHAYASPSRSYPRNIVDDGSSISDSYDFVICGGGLAGLVLASRLSEDSNHTVLVLEAGDTGDAVADQINHPGDTYWDSLGTTSYNWGFYTAAQSGLANRDIVWPRGKVLGGSSATNGLYLVWPSASEVNAWEDLIASDDADAAAVWGWDSFSSALKTSETFSAPSSDIQTLANIEYNTADHGDSGPVHSSYPGYSFGLVGNWTDTWETYGVAAVDSAYGGTNLGAYIANSAINPSNWTRSYSRSAYIDPLPPRSNLQILANAACTAINWDTSNSSNITATSVSYAATAGDTAQNVTINKELILAGGAIGSPQLLLLSGVGPSDAITSVGLSVVNNLPGVGQNLQDHLVGAIDFSTAAETAGDLFYTNNSVITSDVFLSYVNSATAYLNATMLLGSTNKSSLSSTISSMESTGATTLIPSTDATVIAGYKAIYEASLGLFDNDTAQIEILQSITAQNTVIIQAAIQHPFSRGHIYINSTSIFDTPVIDPGYFSHSADIEIMREGMKLARIIGNTAPLSSYLTGETSPGTSVSTDDEWDTWMQSNLGTEYHPMGSCSMLPLDQGGVVNAKLQVYGTANVRVIDASVFPINFSSHLGAPTYALAEQGAKIIRALYNGLAVTPSSSTSSSSAQATGSTDSSNGVVGLNGRTSSSVVFTLSILAMAMLLL